MATAPVAPGPPGTPGRPPPLRRTVGLGILIGAANALGLLGFEWLTDHLIDLIWNDWAGSDEVRWLVVPLAIAGSVAFSLSVRATRQTRLQPPRTDVLAEVEGVKPGGRLSTIAVLLIIGVVSLVGGASLGPEGAVLPASIALGAWAAGKTDEPGPMTELLVLSSIGALLVSFFGSPIPTPIPLLMLHRQGKSLTRRNAIPPVLAGLTAWGIVSVARGTAQGRDIMPIDSGGDLSAIVPALVLGILAVLVGVLLRLVIRATSGWTARLDRLWHWIAAAAVFGAVLGALYWI
ncbi:MAG TPA: chloride channel protein, partial [Casimicrobiaceae bacterium]